MDLLGIYNQLQSAQNNQMSAEYDAIEQQRQNDFAAIMNRGNARGMLFSGGLFAEKMNRDTSKTIPQIGALLQRTQEQINKNQVNYQDALNYIQSNNAAAAQMNQQANAIKAALGGGNG